MAETPEPEHCDELPGPGAAIPQGIEGGEAGAHQRSRLAVREIGRYQGQRAGGGDHELRVAPVEREARDLASHAGEELAAAAVVAISAIAPVPPDARPLALRPSGDAAAHRIDDPRHLMTGTPGVLDPGKASLFDERIAVADAARLDFDPDRSRARLRDRPFHNLNSALTPRDLRNPHRRHDNSSFCPQEAVMPTVLPRPSFYADDWARQRVTARSALGGMIISSELFSPVPSDRVALPVIS